MKLYVHEKFRKYGHDNELAPETVKIEIMINLKYICTRNETGAVMYHPLRLRATHFLVSSLTVMAAAGIIFPFRDYVGYRAVALILLFIVSLLAMRYSLYPVLLAAFLSALIWDFFFIPPSFTLHVNDPEDALMLGMYFIIAVLNGVLTARIRRLEKLAMEKNSRIKTLKLYDSLFNSISHELRTPISTILGASDNLLMAGSELGEQNKALLCREINGAAERLNKLTNDLLNLSRLESGMLKPKFDWCDVRELIHTVVNSPELAETSRVSVDIQGGMPLVRLDFVLMEQALRNLVLNAVKHTGEGDTITVSADYQNGNLQLSVLDSGDGFPAGELENLFEKFHRLSNSRTGGVGLGLSIAKGFVEANGGTISANNNPGGGAQIKIVIPAASANQSMPEHE